MSDDTLDRKIRSALYPHLTPSQRARLHGIVRALILEAVADAVASIVARDCASKQN